MTDVHAVKAKILDARRHLQAALDLLVSATLDSEEGPAEDLWADVSDAKNAASVALSRVDALSIAAPTEPEPDERHHFEFTVRLRGDDSNWGSIHGPIKVRAWDLVGALRAASELPFDVLMSEDMEFFTPRSGDGQETPTDLPRMWWKPADDKGPGCLSVEVAGGPKWYRRHWDFAGQEEKTEWGWVLADTAVQLVPMTADRTATHQPAGIRPTDWGVFICCSCGKNPTPKIWLEDHWAGDEEEGKRLVEEFLTAARDHRPVDRGALMAALTATADETGWSLQRGAVPVLADAVLALIDRSSE